MNADLKMSLLRALIILTCFGMLSSSCGDQRPDIVGCWTHYYEEGQNIYKSCDSQEFGPSRFRQQYDFKSDGSVTYRDLQPADGYLVTEAQWEFMANRSQIQIRGLLTNDLIVQFRLSIIDRKTIELIEIP